MKIRSLANDIRLMFSSDKQLIKKYNEDPEGLAEAIARKKKVRKRTAVAAIVLAIAIVMGLKTNSYLKEKGEFKNIKNGIRWEKKRSQRKRMKIEFKMKSQRKRSPEGIRTRRERRERRRKSPEFIRKREERLERNAKKKGGQRKSSQKKSSQRKKRSKRRR